MHMEPSDKGWLRQLMPKHTPDHQYRFIEGVRKRMDHISRPTEQQTQAAREAAYRDMMGASAC